MPHDKPRPPGPTSSSEPWQQLEDSSPNEHGVEHEIEYGVATDLWLELLHHGRQGHRRLSLLVDDEWRHLERFSYSTQASVQSVFCDCSSRCEVVVWYCGEKIVSLCVRSKYSSEPC